MPTAPVACGTRRRPPSRTGHPPLGGAPAADLRGRPARVSQLPRRHAHRRLHHPDGGDRPDPHPPPDPRRARGARRAAEPPINAGPREPGGVTRPTPVRRRSAGHLRTARRPATTRGSSVWAAVPPARRLGPRRHRSPHSARRSHGPRGARTRQRARRHPPVGARAAGDRALYSTDPNRNSYPACAHPQAMSRRSSPLLPPKREVRSG